MSRHSVIRNLIPDISSFWIADPKQHKRISIAVGQLITTLIIIGLFCSCSKDRRTLYLKVDSVDGLTDETTVTINGFQIGEVDNVSIANDNKIMIKLSLNQEPELPKDTEFKIYSRDLLGTKGIAVTVGTDDQMLTDRDTVITTNETSILATDSVTFKVMDILDNLTGAKQRDSILIELRRLNNNLEKLEKENKK